MPLAKQRMRDADARASRGGAECSSMFEVLCLPTESSDVGLADVWSRTLTANICKHILCKLGRRRIAVTSSRVPWSH